MIAIYGNLHVILFAVTQYFYLYISTFRVIHIIIIIIIIIIVIIALSALIKFSPTGTVASLPAKKLTTVFQVSQYLMAK